MITITILFKTLEKILCWTDIHLNLLYIIWSVFVIVYNVMYCVLFIIILLNFRVKPILMYVE